MMACWTSTSRVHRSLTTSCWVRNSVALQEHLAGDRVIQVAGKMDFPGLIQEGSSYDPVSSTTESIWPEQMGNKPSKRSHLWIFSWVSVSPSIAREFIVQDTNLVFKNNNYMLQGKIVGSQCMTEWFEENSLNWFGTGDTKAFMEDWLHFNYNWTANT